MTTSLLEALNTDRTVADKARFVDYFSGDSLKSWWTVGYGVGASGGSSSMKDAIDGGFNTAVTVNDTGYGIRFNDIEPFDSNNCVGVFNTRNNTGGGTNYQIVGLSQGSPFTGTNHQAIVYHRPTTESYIQLRTGGGSVSNTDSVITPNAQWNLKRIECISTDTKLYLNNSLNITKTTGIPTNAVQPAFYHARVTGNGNSDINYCEVWNI